ncbi:MAG TPA: hypothetical protein VHK91_16170 [Flavisolibacter sp.]|nr:hypothetical protein [Flavisolibacter sp.]
MASALYQSRKIKIEMEGDPARMATHEIVERIKDLEDMYADALMDYSDNQILTQIYNRIKELTKELKKRQ